MEYSKDIILGINYKEVNKKGQAQATSKKEKLKNFIKKHKVIATISLLCGILIVLDYILVNNFIILLQKLV